MALDIPGWDLTNASSQRLKLKEKGNVITFYYKAQEGSYTVYYVDMMTGKELHDSKVVTGHKAGDVVTEYAVDILGYTVLESTKTFTIQAVKNYIYFIYYTIDS